MKKHWIRGTLLGLSLALLLAGGVAMANGLLYIDFDREPPCVVCVRDGDLISDANVLMITYGGWSAYPDTFELCDVFVRPGDEVALCVPRLIPEEDPLTEHFGPCPCPGEGNHAASCGVLGEWSFDVWVSDPGNLQSALVDRISRTFLFLEVCPEVEEEFVPEPGTVVLLGSGLMGLAGYATLRWRTRE